MTGQQPFLSGSADTEDAALVRDGLRRRVQEATAARTNVLGYPFDEWLSGHQSS